MSNYHVIQRRDGWAIRRSGSIRASKIRLTYRQALRLARKWANIIYVHSPKTGLISKRIVVNA